MKRVLIILAIIALFGCISQPQNQNIPNQTTNTSSAPNNTPSCEGYCHNILVPSCSGNWEISGNYPDCKCDFVCTPPQNETPPSLLPNNTPEVPTPPSPPVEPPPVQTPPANFSQMLDSALSKVSNEFYQQHSGQFRERTSSWKRNVYPQNSIDISPSEIRFNEVSIATIQSSGYVVFEGTNSYDIFGVAIFDANSTPLDLYGFTGKFDVRYVPQPISRTLENCTTYNKEYTAHSGDKLAITYYFQCEKLNGL